MKKTFLVFLLAAASALPATAAPGNAVPTVEVAPEREGADMDDPAIWIHPDRARAGESLVVATAKRGGLRVYDLAGKTVQSLHPPRDANGKPANRFNNVDIQYGFPLDGKRVDIVVASDRIRDRLSIWTIASGRPEPLVEVTDPAIPRLFPTHPAPSAEAGAVRDNPDDGKRTAYGLALYRDRKAGRYFALVTQAGEAVVAQWELHAAPGGRVSARFVKQWVFPYRYKGQDLTAEDKADPARSFSPQFEGLVVDQQSAIAYAGQEDVGIWRIDLKSGRAEPAPFVETRAFDPESPLARDVEGLTLYYGDRGEGYLLASSQGSVHGKNPSPIPEVDDTFAVFTRAAPNRYLGSFRVGPNAEKGIDGVQECDGADVTSVPLPGFPGGMFVTQDGYDDDRFGPDGTTNMKFTPWASVAGALPAKLLAKSRYDPRRP